MKYKFTHPYQVGDRKYHPGDKVPKEADIEELLALDYVAPIRTKKRKKKEASWQPDEH